MTAAHQSQALAPKKSQTLSSYSVLLRRVRLAFAEGRERAVRAVEREKVRTAWESGKLILEHILLNEDRADYGKQVAVRLAADLRKSVTEVHYYVEFARAYPILPAPGELTWAHYRELLGINDASLREKLAKESAKKNWNQKELRLQIKKLKAANQSAVSGVDKKPAPLVAKKGVPYTYRIKKVGDDLKIDLGFSNYLSLRGVFSRGLPQPLALMDKCSTGTVWGRPSPAQEEGRFLADDAGLPLSSRAGGGKFAEGDIVQSVKSGAGGKTARPSAASANDIFTYHARVLQVTDGDTVWVLLDLGFGFTTKQHLRFRGIDAFEIDTRKGRAGKKYLEGILNKSPDVIITSSKSDKYDRYLADVWSGGRCLNQELLDKRLAVRVTG